MTREKQFAGLLKTMRDSSSSVIDLCVRFLAERMSGCNLCFGDSKNESELPNLTGWPFAPFFGMIENDNGIELDAHKASRIISAK